MFIEYCLKKLFDRIPGDFAMPFRVVLWYGCEFKLSYEPTVAVYVSTLSALGYFIPPNLNKLGEAFVEGHISVEESVHKLFRVAESLVSKVAANKHAAWSQERTANNSPYGSRSP